MNNASWAFQTLDSPGWAKLRCAALGFEGVCFPHEAGRPLRIPYYHLGSHYTILHDVLSELHNGDIEVSSSRTDKRVTHQPILASVPHLNPYRVDEFFLLLANNVAVFRGSQALRDGLLDLLAQHNITCKDLSSQITDKARPKVPAAAHEPAFLKGLAKEVATSGAGAIVGGVVSGLVGAAACSVV